MLLEIPDYPDKEAFFAFKHGLQNWAKMEIQRHGVQDLATAISIAESLIEFRKFEKSKSHKDKVGKGKSGEERPSNKGRFHKFNGPKERKNTKEGQSSGRPPLKCYFCDRLHKARDCLRKAKLSAIVEEREG